MGKNILLYLALLSFLLLPLAQAVAGSLTITYQLLNNRTDPGEENIVFLTLANPSSTAVYDLKATIATGDYISTQTNYIAIGALSAGASQQVSFKFIVSSNATPIISYILAKVQYYRDPGYAESIDLNIPIIIGKEPILQVQNVNYNSTAQAGSTVAVAFSLTNFGSTAKSVRVMLNQTKFVSSSNELYIEEISPRQSKEVSFVLTIDPSVPQGTYTLPVYLTYSDGTKTNTYNTIKNIGLVVSGVPELVVTADTENLFLGRISKLTVSIANKGKAAAEFLTAKAWSEFGETEVYVGKIDSDDYETVEVKQDLTRAKGQYPLYLNLTYKDIYNNKYLLQKTLNIVPSAAPVEIPYTIIGILVVAAIGVYWWKRKK